MQVMEVLLLLDMTRPRTPRFKLEGWLYRKVHLDLGRGTFQCRQILQVQEQPGLFIY